MKTLTLSLFLLFVAIQSFAQLTFLGNKTYTQDLSDVWGYVDENNNEYAIVGVYNGVSIVDVTNPSAPNEVFFVSGANSIWRDIKTFGDYAYITNETSGGVMIIDLSPLPGSTNLTVTFFTGGGLNSAHNLYIDENGIMYIFGSNLGNGGVRMYDVATTPGSPVLVGTFENWYVHDGMARGDTLYLGNVLDGFFSIIDVSSKSSPVVLGTHASPNNFTHNVWVSDDGDYLYTTDEVSGGYIGAYDISSMNNIFETDRIRSSPGSGVIPHNVHYFNGYLVTSYYRDGLTIHDAHNPENLIEIARYDSSPLSGNGFNGAWGAYPWLPSGNILVTDIEGGLFVLGVNYFRAAYLEGTVKDSICGTDLPGATITFSSESEISDIFGEYKMGTASPGTYSVTFSAPGYVSKTINNVSLTAGNITMLNVELYSTATVAVVGNVAMGGQVLSGAEALMTGDSSSYTFVTDSMGEFTRCNVLEGNYTLTVGKWGSQTKCQNVTISNSVNTLNVQLTPGYYDDFTFDFGWTVSGNATSGVWERGVPIGTSFMGLPSNPGSDVSGDCGDRAYVTGNGGGAAGDDDIDGGITVLTSPVFDLSSFSEPTVKYNRWFFNGGGGSAPDDTLIVRLSNGISTVVLEKVIPNLTGSPAWVQKQFLVSDYITPTANMSITFEAGDYGLGHLVEAGIDRFEVVESVSVAENNPLYLEIFPNPSSGEFNLKGIPFSGKLSVFDITGKLVSERSVERNSTIRFGQELLPGVYTVVLFGENYPLLTSKIIRISQ